MGRRQKETVKEKHDQGYVMIDNTRQRGQRVRERHGNRRMGQ